MQPTDKGKDYLEFKYAGEKELTCWFYEGKFFQAVFKPGLGDGDKQGLLAIDQGLEEKYGSGQMQNGYVDGLLNIPLLVKDWNDGETRIRYKMWDPEQWVAAQNRRGMRLSIPSGTLEIRFTSLALENQKEQDEKNATDRAEAAERSKKKAGFKNDL